MNKSNMGILSSFLIMGVFGTASVSAAPSVRMLGTNNARIGTNATVVHSDTSGSKDAVQRLGSVRARNITGGAPVTVNKVPTKSSVSSVADNTSRLSLGKYIHSSGVSAGKINTVPTVSSTDFTSLADRVSDIAADVADLKDEMPTKQPLLYVGEGLVLADDTISFDEEYSELPSQVDSLQENITNNYYTSDQVKSYVQNYVEGNVVAEYNSVSGEQTYDVLKIADKFDKEGFKFVLDD